MENDPKSFIFEEKWQKVFVYGKEVDDFHALNKQALFTLNFSATQEIDRIQQQEKTKLTAAEAKIVTLEAENATLKARLDVIEAKLL
jgi:cell shape-determining protein MreC